MVAVGGQIQLTGLLQWHWQCWDSVSRGLLISEQVSAKCAASLDQFLKSVITEALLKPQGAGGAFVEQAPAAL